MHWSWRRASRCLHRSTRKLTLTEAGERCYPHCRRLTEAARAAADSLAQAPRRADRRAPRGRTSGLRCPHRACALAPLLAQSPQLRLRLLVDDTMIDLIDAQIDIAIRVGRLADSSWTARSLCEFEMILCASPAYIERKGAPRSPHDLIAPQTGSRLRARRWRPARDEAAPTIERLPTLAVDLHGAAGERQRVDVGVRIASNNLLSLQQMCEQGLGMHALLMRTCSRHSSGACLCACCPRGVLSLCRSRRSHPVGMANLQRYGWLWMRLCATSR